MRRPVSLGERENRDAQNWGGDNAFSELGTAYAEGPILRLRDSGHLDSII
jgi:hypothetical protein